ncbi:MAG TPA: AarF/UbiB family protein [Planctomycetota bacterium]|nr:AarF/UbiB family protein [Planctomycetota bacterium]
MTGTTLERPSLGGRIRQYRDAGLAVSRWTFVTLRRGVLPSGLNGLRVLVREGRSDLHWKVLGDSLASVLEDAGPLATKVGQILATRTDLIPEALGARLEVLFERQRPMTRTQLRRALDAAYGGAPPFELEEKPLGVGSVGQVHRAKLAGGERVVVKVLRPGVAAAIERDLRAAHALLPLVVPLAGGDRTAARRLLDRALDDLAAGFRRETDLLAEADSLVEFRERLQRNPRVVVPLCHRALCRPGVLVMEQLEGESLASFRRRAREDPDAARRVAALAFKEILQQVFEDGRFHADPHAGNLLVLPDGRLGILDLGLTGELGPGQRAAITQAIRAFLARDPGRVVRALLGLGAAPPDFQVEAFEREVVLAVSSIAPGPDRLERLVNDLLAVARRHEIEIPRATTHLVKALVTIEGVARSLDPDLDLARAALPVILTALRPRWLDKLAFWRPRRGP